MTLRRAFLALSSIALAAILLFALIRLGNVNLHVTLHQLERVSAVNLIVLVVLNGLIVCLSTLKWRKIDAVIRKPSDAVPSWPASFLVSSVGMALGLVLPVQFGMTVARTVGTHMYGRAVQRGTAGTLFEQGFDLLVIVLAALASAVTWLCGGNGTTWLICVLTIIAIALVAAEPSIRIALWFLRRVTTTATRDDSAGLRGRFRSLVLYTSSRAAKLGHSGLLNAQLARSLIVLAAARFALVILFANQTSEAIGAHIVLWRMAAATPFASLANLLGLTPGGVGINELTASAALHIFGTPLTVASQWSLANRILGTGACFTVAACACLIWAASRVLPLGPPILIPNDGK